MANLFGNLIDYIGTGLNLPEFRLSERVAGGPTTFTGSNPDLRTFEQRMQQNNPVTFTGGQVLGTTTGGGGGGAGYTPTNNVQTQQTSQPSGPSAPSYEDQMRDSINAGWDSYTSQLNDMLNVGLPGQKTAQEQIANETYTGGVNQLGSQKASSTAAVESQQAKSLKDLSENVRNLFQSGNVYLGARGAGDSSAANQYSYALTKLGSKGRGDIMTQANDRLNQIGDIYNSEFNRLETEKNTRIAQIADWFNSAQNQIRSQIGQAGLGKQQDIQALSTNLYNQALSAMQSLQAEQASQRQALESWALSNSKNVQEVIGNLQKVQQLPAFQGIQAGMPQVTPQGGFYVPTGYGTTAQKKDIFGNPIA